MPNAMRIIDNITELTAPGFVSGQTPMWDGTQFIPRRFPALSTRILIVDINGTNDFTSIKDACDYIATQSPAYNKVWEVHVKPGVYEEDSFTVPAGVQIIGDSAIPSYGVTGGECPTVKPKSYMTSGDFITSSPTALATFVNLYFDIQTSPSSTGAVNGFVCDYMFFVDCRFNFYNRNTANQLTGFLCNNTAYFNRCHISTTGTSNTWALRSNAGTILIRFSWLNGNGAKIKNGGSATCYVFMTKFNDSSKATNYDIENTSSNPVYVAQTNYWSTSGSLIYDLDRLVNVEAQGIREAASADITPLTVIAATGQTADLRVTKTATGAILESLTKDGELKLAVDPARKIFMSTSFI